MAATTGENILIAIAAKDTSQGAVNSSATSIHAAGTAMEKMHDKMTAQFQNYQALWLRMTAGLAAIYGAFRMIEQAAKFEEQKAQLQGMAAQWNTSADAIIASCKEASDGELSMAQSAQLAAKALLYLTPDQLGPFIEAAERLGKITGKDIPEGFAAFEKAVVTGKSRGLYEALGITVDLDSALKQYANSLGVNVDSLDQQTKMQVRANAVMYEAQRQIEMLGPAVETNADRIDKLKAVIADLRLNLGTYLMRMGLAVYGALQWLASGALNLYSYAKRYQSLYLEYLAGAEQDAEVSAAYSQMAKIAGADAQAASDASAATMETAMKYMNAATASAQNLSLAIRRDKRAASEPFDGKKYEDEKRRMKELEALMQEIRNRQEISNLSHDARELVAMDQKHEQQIQKLTELQATQAQIDEATTLMDQERMNLEYTQHVKHLNQLLMESMKRGDEELKLHRQNAAEYLKLQDERYKRESELVEYAAAYQKQKLDSAIAVAKSQIDALRSGASGYNTGVGIMASTMDDMMKLASGQYAASKDIDRAYEHYLVLEEAYLFDYLEHQKEIDDAYLQYIKACEDYNMKFQMNVTKGMFGMLSGVAYMVYELSDKKSKELFLLYKAFAIVETLISTYIAAVAAFDTALEYYEQKTHPAVAAAIAAAYYAITLAAGMVRVAYIANQSYEGGSSVSSSAAGSVIIPIIADEEESEEEGAGEVTIDINIYGDVVDHDNKFYLETVPYLERIIDSKRTYAVKG